MIDKFGFDTAFSNITDTHFDMRVKVFVSPVFLTWIMNFGADVTVLSPESEKMSSPPSRRMCSRSINKQNK